MGLSLASIGKRIEGLGAQINPFDNGATYNTVLQNRPPTPNTPSFGTRYSPGNVAGAFGNAVNQVIAKPVVNTLRLPADYAGLGVSTLFNNPNLQRQQANRLTSDALNSFIGPLAHYAVEGGTNLAINKILNNPKIRPEVKQAVLKQAAEPAYNALGVSLQDKGPRQVVKEAANFAQAAATPVGFRLGGPIEGELPKLPQTNEAGFINLAGKNVGKETAAQQEQRIAAMHQKVQVSLAKPPKVSAELQNLQNRYETPLEPNNLDQVMAQSTGLSKGQITNERDIAQRKLEAETQALNHLQNGGTRDEAANLFQKATGTTKKDALFQVQRVAKEAKTSLNVSPQTPNPLSGQFHLPNAQPGDFMAAPRNQMTVTNNIDRALQAAQKSFKGLSVEDRQKVPHTIEGTAKTNDPAILAAAKASQHLTDTVHAVGEPYGATPHISSYFPRYFADHAAQTPEAQMAIEEAAVGGRSIPLQDQGNYAGFHSKSRIFKTRQEATDAGFVMKNEDPLADLERYAAGAKINIGNQAFIKAAREADQTINPQMTAEESLNSFGDKTHTVDLPGNQAVRVSSQAFKTLKGYGVKAPPNIVKRALQGTSKSIVRTIVANPVFHGGNQEFNAVFAGAWRIPGNKVANIGKFIKNHATITQADRDAFYKDGGFSPNYGKNDYGFIAKGLEKAGIDPAKAELSPRAMASIEENIRVSLSKVAKSRGMSADETNAVINKVLGGPDLIGDFASSYGLFQHYLQTNLKLLGDTGKQAAKGNLAPLAGLALGTAAWYGATKAWQDATGNKNATVRAPGVLGTAIQVGKGVNQVRRGQVPSVITSHTNPLITTGIEQATNRDLRKPVVGALGQSNNLDNQRLKVAAANTVGPGLTVQNVAGQKTSPAEAALGYATGLYTPHAKGYQAAPKVSFLNSKNAQPGTGLDQQKQYFAAHDQLLKTVYGDKRASDAVNNYLDRNKNAQGQSVQLNPEESISAYKGLAGNSKALSAVQKFEQSANKSHPPMWDLSSADLKSFLNYEGTVKTDPTKAVKLDLGGDFNGGEGLSNFIKRNSAWYNQQPPHPGSSVPAPGTPTYPNVPSATLSQYSSISNPSQKSAFLDSHPEVIRAFNDVAKYNNQLGVAQGGNALKNYPEASTQLQSFMNTYSGASKAQRKTIRSASPQQYKNMIAFFDSVDLYNINKTGAKNQYVGEPDQTSGQNKAISNLAKDIYQNPDKSYSIVPAGWMQGLTNSSSGSSFKSAKFAKSYHPRTPRNYRKKVAFGKGKKPKVGAKIAKREDEKGKAKVSLKASLV